MRTIAVANQKGGVGKTTTSVNLAASLAAEGRRVLLIDLDPQGNATTGSGADKHNLDLSTCEVLLGEASVAEACTPMEEAGFSLIGANSDLVAAEVELMNAALRERRLRLALESAAEMYDITLIDCPPSLNMLTINALVAAQGVLVPIQCEYYALEGLSALLNTIEKVSDALNPELQLDGLVRTMYDGRNNLASQVSAQLREHFGDILFRTVVPRNVRVAEAPSYGMPVLTYDPSSRGARAYQAVAQELLARLGGKQAEQATGATPGMTAGDTAPM